MILAGEARPAVAPWGSWGWVRLLTLDLMDPREATKIVKAGSGAKQALG